VFRYASPRRGRRPYACVVAVPEFGVRRGTCPSPCNGRALQTLPGDVAVRRPATSEASPTNHVNAEVALTGRPGRSLCEEKRFVRKSVGVSSGRTARRPPGCPPASNVSVDPTPRGWAGLALGVARVTGTTARKVRPLVDSAPRGQDNRRARSRTDRRRKRLELTLRPIRSSTARWSKYVRER